MSYLSNTTSLTRAAPIPDTALRIGLASSSASPDSSLDSMAFLDFCAPGQHSLLFGIASPLAVIAGS